MKSFFGFAATAVFLMSLSITFSPFVNAGAAVVDGDPPPAEEEQEASTPAGGSSLRDLGFDPSTTPSLPTLGLDETQDPVEAVDSLLLNYVVNPIFFLAGGTAVIVILYSAFRIVVARGEEEGLTAAKNALIWAFAGLALVLLAYTLVRNLVEIVLTQL